MSSVAQRSFASGELAPAVHPRTDADQYGRGLKTLRNFTVLRSGGARTRAGFLYLDHTAVAAARQPFSLADWVQALGRPLVLEFGERAGGLTYVRFWTNGTYRGTRLKAGYSAAAWVTATAYAQGVVVERSGAYYYCTAAHTSGAGTEPGTGGSWTTVWYLLELDAAGDPIAEIPLPYSPTQLMLAQWADESPTIRYFVAEDFPLYQLVDATVAAGREGYFDGSFAAATFVVTDAVDAPTNVQISGDAGSSAADDTRYFITAVDGVLEGEASANVQWSRYPGPGTSGNYSPITLTWDAVAGADAYNIYRSRDNDAFRLVTTVVGATTWTDRGTPRGAVQYGSPTDAIRLNTFDAAGEYPSVIAAHQQRLVLSGLTNRPDVVYASRSAAFLNFSQRSPILDDDAISWRQVNTRLNAIRHIAEANGRLVLFGDFGEGVATGDTDAILRPGEANPRTITFNGAARTPRPLNVNVALLYVQARGSLVRDLVLEGEGRSADLTIISHHLVDGYGIVAWCFQQTPDPVIWAVRSDGVLLSLTYAPENGVLAWARHDTQGATFSPRVHMAYAGLRTTGVGTQSPSFLSVACVPSLDPNFGDTVYALVEREGGTFVEMMMPRVPPPASHLGGTSPYAAGAPFLLDCAAGEGTAIVDTALTGAAPAVDYGTFRITGLDHLEGEAVAVVAFAGNDDDAPIVLRSPASTPGLVTVVNGEVQLTEDEVNTYGGLLAAGLPIICDLETLDIDTVDGRSMKERGISISRLGAWVEQSRTFFAGPELPASDALTDMMRVTLEDPLTTQPLTVEIADGYLEGNLLGRFNKSGRICIRHVEAIPLTVHAVMPMGRIGG